MAFNPVDAFTRARWTFEDTSLGSPVGVPTISSVDHVYPDPIGSPSQIFVDSVNGVELNFVDSDFASGTGLAYKLAVPGLFKKRSLALLGGSASQQRDYLYGANSIEPAGSWAASMWFLPYSLGAGLANVFGKYYASANNNPSVNGLGSVTWVSPFVSCRFSFGDNADGRIQVDWNHAGTLTNTILGTTTPSAGSSALARVRNGLWNLFGWSWESGTLSISLNGLIVHTLSIGAIDWGTHGEWNIGGTPNKSANVEHFDGQLGPFQIDDGTGRNAAWWADYYMSTGTSGGGPPQVSFG